MDCIFCQIAQKKLPAKLVYESDNVLVFPDINPETEIHLLIIPKKHITGMGDLTQAHSKLLTEIFEVAKKLVKDYNLENDHYRVRVNGGKAQHVPHIHFHLLGGQYIKN